MAHIPAVPRYDQESIDPPERRVHPFKLLDVYILTIPLGWAGAHHFYLGRKGWGTLYLLTLGCFGFGWIYDIIRLRWLVKSINGSIEDPENLQFRKDDAYLLVIIFGWLGFHQFYLKRRTWGLLYMFTFGVFFVGWIVDIVRMHWLIESARSGELRDMDPDMTVCCT